MTRRTARATINPDEPLSISQAAALMKGEDKKCRLWIRKRIALLKGPARKPWLTWRMVLDELHREAALGNARATRKPPMANLG